VPKGGQTVEDEGRNTSQISYQMTGNDGSYASLMVKVREGSGEKGKRTCSFAEGTYG